MKQEQQYEKRMQLAGLEECYSSAAPSGRSHGLVENRLVGGNWRDKIGIFIMRGEKQHIKC